jgi:glucose uptake protein GlcU
MENQKAPTHPLGTFLEVIGYISAIVCGIVLGFMLMSGSLTWLLAVEGCLAAFMIAGLGVIINTLTGILHRLPVLEPRRAERPSVEATSA